MIKQLTIYTLSTTGDYRWRAYCTPHSIVQQVTAFIISTSLNIAMRLTLLLLPLLFLLLIADRCLASQRVALVIGNGSYASAPLKNPVNDAKDITSLLESFDFEVIRKINVNKRQMLSGISTFAKKLNNSEIGLFYYAGHGMQIDGRNYLIPVGVNVDAETDVEFEAVDAGRIIRRMKTVNNPLNVVILDACRNNPFARSFRSTNKGLARMDAPKGTIIAYATGAGEVAVDGKGRNGIFTKHLLQAMKKPGSDIRDVINEAGMGVMVETDDRQIPWISNSPVPTYYLAGGSFVVDAPVKGLSSGQKEKGNATGSLRITSTPSGAILYINGHEFGTTPVNLSGIPAEATTLRAELTGYTAKEKQVQVRSGIKTTVSFALSSLARKGWLNVNPKPAEAKVRILNIGPRYTPGIELDPGRYQVEVAAGGYERVVRWVVLAAGERLDLDITLERLVGSTSSSSYTDPTTGMEFVLIKGGCFQMGQTRSEKAQIIKERGQEKYDKYYKNELPRHEVCVDDYYMGKYEVTVGQWRKFIGDTGYTTDAEKDTEKEGCYSPKNGKWGWRDGQDWESPGFSQRSNAPVVCVSHTDVVAFTKWLNRQGAGVYRLATEAEWEYGARGGMSTARYWGDGVDSKACSYANVNDKKWGGVNGFPCDDGHRYTAPVGNYKSNAFGLYDMLGNVWEWTGDWYGSKYYSSSPNYNPTGPASGVNRVNRGGGWSNDAAGVRAAYRGGGRPWGRSAGVGFRLVLPPRTGS